MWDLLGYEGDEQILKVFGGMDTAVINNTLKRDTTKSKEEALIDFYRKMRPAEPITPEAAENLFYRLFL
jgi:DNA-directed RNA polymerase subunit beta